MIPMKTGSNVKRDSMPPSPTELDNAWDTLSVENTSAGYRSKQPTPHDEDPLRHFAANEESPDKPRDKLPTLPEIDPLRHDLEPKP